MTRLELQQRTLRALNESPTAPTYWALTEMQGYLNEALEVMAEEVGFTKRTFTVPRRPGVQVYQLAGIGPNIIAPYRVYLPDYKRRLDAKTLQALDGWYERWMEAVNIPECWVSLGWDAFLVGLHETTPTGNLEVNCYCFQEALEDDNDIPELQPTSHEALVDYAKGLGFLKQWQGEDTIAAWQKFFTKYGHAKAQAGINRVQSRYWARDSRSNDK